MAYENYNEVTWTDGTPITGARLAQMSTNMAQIKDATDDSPQGLKRLKTITSNSATYTDFATTHEIINLSNQSGSGGADNRVTISPSRYYRVSLNFTGFTVDAKGAEDATYVVSIWSGVFNTGVPARIYSAQFTPPSFSYIDVSSAGGAATIANIALRNNSYDSRFGAGNHSVILQSNVSGLNNGSFFSTVERYQGASATNAPGFWVPATTSATSTASSLQLYAEDIGGV